ncbi:diacylglycerol kinase family lipid kinase [Dactylosporangium vinaceum]|uniref:Diacylglycerol/lipid kinase family protein n=1 Tax=Dactylosporangium vinaceum TaxID=53362 RepID=A0ABV5LZZ8_9ACTN|nr:diacylglycerol kinase family protein [Dactylosporangium vinaceum]
MKVAVVAHRKKTFGAGLAGLRTELERAGAGKVDWREVPKSKKAPKQVRKAVDAGADLIFVWGGDGMVQRCVDTLAAAGATGVTLAILPAGTANLFASALRIPRDIRAAVQIGLEGERRRYDLGKVDGEHFAVMAGAGFDAAMIEDADRGMKRRAGRLAYWRTALRHVGDAPVHTIVHLDDEPWFEGPATCLLMGNIGTISGGIKAFDDASPFDGRLEVGVTTARGALQWARTIGTMATGRTDRSRFVKMGSASRVYAEFAEPVLLELDGGARKRVKRLEAEAVAAAVTIAVPAGT